MRSIYIKRLYWGALAIPVIAFIIECLFGPGTADGDVFRYIGGNMASGGRLYETAWDNKGPVLFLPQYLGYLLFPWGNWGPGFIIMLMWIGLGVLFHHWLLTLCKDKTLSTLAMFIMILTASGMDGLANQNAQEPTTLFFVLAGLTASFCLHVRIGSLILGACVAAAFLVKPNLVSFGAASIVMWSYDLCKTRNWPAFWSRILFSFLGFAGTITAVTGYFGLTGRGFALWDATLLFGLFEYGNRDVTIWGFWQKWFTIRLQDPLGGNHNIWVLPLYIALFFSSLIGVVQLWKSGRKALSVFFMTWLTGEYAMALCMRQFFEHYLVMLCPVAVTLSAFAFQPLARHSHKTRTFFTFSICLLTVWYGVYDIGMTHAVWRNGRVTNWKLRLKQWSTENRVDRLITLGSLPAAGILDYLKINANQKYFAVLMNYKLAKADWRKREMEDDLLNALRDQRSKWLFSEKSLEDVARTFSTRPEMSHELECWTKSFEIPSGAIYKRSDRPIP